MVQRSHTSEPLVGYNQHIEFISVGMRSVLNGMGTDDALRRDGLDFRDLESERRGSWNGRLHHTNTTWNLHIGKYKVLYYTDSTI